MKRSIEWQVATVTSVRTETPEVKTLTLALPNWMPHRPGQHYDVRLTAHDGYSAQRSYSVASEPERTGEIDITVENFTLTIRGEKKTEQTVKDDQFHRVGRSYGTFTRSFALPHTVDAHKVEAEYKDGVLTIKLPQREEAKPKQIKVNVAA